MSAKPYFLSLNHQFTLDENLPALAALDERSLDLIKNAAGVLMPKYFSPLRYQKVLSLAKNHFPDLRTRYACRGKAEQTRLLERNNIPHPRTEIFDSPAQAIDAVRTQSIRFDYPFVLKGDRGGGGATVFLIESSEDLEVRLAQLPQDQPVLLQELIDHGGLDLRVVLMGRGVCSYFRVGNGSFYNNVSKGARIEPDIHPEKQRTGQSLALDLARTANIDLAGFDILFPAQGPPLMLEINFLFGKKGLGGLKGYNRMYRRAVYDWIKRVKNGL
ncbi:MAG: hypothetical protein K9K64_02855 [Desulfohalobiaceae bacterium]|nr:hypothetical protein [Desulfohalobiaceae bacterium]